MTQLLSSPVPVVLGLLLLVLIFLVLLDIKNVLGRIEAELEEANDANHT